MGGLFNFQRWKVRARSESEWNKSRDWIKIWGNWVPDSEGFSKWHIKRQRVIQIPWLPLLCSLWAACSGRFEKPVSQVWTWVSVSLQLASLKPPCSCAALWRHIACTTVTGLGQARPSIHSTNSYGGLPNACYRSSHWSFSSKKEI